MLEDTTMPEAQELPESLASFRRRHGQVIRADPYYEQDVEALMRRLRITPARRPDRCPQPTSTGRRSSSRRTPGSSSAVTIVSSCTARVSAT